MPQEYPHMLYLGGDTSARHRVVSDADAEKAAAADGYYRASQGRAAKAEKPAAPVEPERKASKKHRA